MSGLEIFLRALQSVFSSRAGLDLSEVGP
jgi:hypothetical protein